MTAKEYLLQLQRLNTMIDQKIKELVDLRSVSMGIGCVDYSKNKTKTVPSGEAPFVKIIDKMVDLDEEIGNEIDAFVDKKHDIINQIQGLRKHKHIEILYKHYVEYKRLEVIAVEMNFTYQYIVELHGHALKDFQKTYENLLKTYGP